MGNHFHEGFKFGFNRFVGTLFGGLIVIPFYWLYYNQPLGIPKEVYLVLGLLCLMYLHILSGATTAIQPGAVIYFVVLFTQPVTNYIPYTIARVIDTVSAQPSACCSTSSGPPVWISKRALTFHIPSTAGSRAMSVLRRSNTPLNRLLRNNLFL